MGNELTGFGNILFALTSLIGILYFHHWQQKQGLGDDTRVILRAWQIKDAAVFFRITWWIFALMAAPDGDTYHEFFVDNKAFITVPTSLMYVYGQFLFVKHITGISNAKRVWSMALTTAAALAVTLVGF
jgi:hypothetical protein